MVSDTATNLRTAIAGETYESGISYPAYARRAEEAGDEADHAAAFERALHHIN